MRAVSLSIANTHIDGRFLVAFSSLSLQHWSNWSGNVPEPESFKDFSVENDLDAEGLTWTLKHKPEIWAQHGVEEAESEDDEETTRASLNQDSFNDPAGMKPRLKRCSTKAMPITDFLISIPTFQHLDRDAITLLEDSCTMQIFFNGKEILSEEEVRKSHLNITDPPLSRLVSLAALLKHHLFAIRYRFTRKAAENVYVVREGFVSVIKRRDYRTTEKVMSLTQGDYFGEGSFTGKQKGSTAAYIADGDVLCITIPMSTYESIFTNSTNLIGDGTPINIDASNNTEVLSLTRHIDQFNELLQMVFVRTKREVLLDPSSIDGHMVDASAGVSFRKSSRKSSANGRFTQTRRSVDTDPPEPKKGRPSLFRSTSNASDGLDEEARQPMRKRTTTTRKARHSVIAMTQDNDADDVSNEALMLDLLTAFTPELSLDDVLERIIKVTREVFCVQRASVFIVDDDAEEVRVCKERI